MYDDANVNQFYGLTASSDCFAGYVDNYVTFPWLEENRAGHKLVSISLFGNAADTLDIESGGATIYMAPGWYRAAKTRKLHTPKPVLYSTAGNGYALIDEMSRSGIPRGDYLYWSAHIGRGEHICGPNVCGEAQADGTQWTWTALGRSLDQSVLNDVFFDGAPDPSPSGGTTILGDSTMFLPSTADGGTVPVALPIGTKFVVFSAVTKMELGVWSHGAKGTEKFNLGDASAYTFAVPKNVREIFVVRETNSSSLLSVAFS